MPGWVNVEQKGTPHVDVRVYLRVGSSAARGAFSGVGALVCIYPLAFYTREGIPRLGASGGTSPQDTRLFPLLIALVCCCPPKTLESQAGRSFQAIQC